MRRHRQARREFDQVREGLRCVGHLPKARIEPRDRQPAVADSVHDPESDDEAIARTKKARIEDAELAWVLLSPTRRRERQGREFVHRRGLRCLPRHSHWSPVVAKLICRAFGLPAFRMERSAWAVDESPYRRWNPSPSAVIAARK